VTVRASMPGTDAGWAIVTTADGLGLR